MWDGRYWRGNIVRVTLQRHRAASAPAPRASGAISASIQAGAGAPTPYAAGASEGDAAEGEGVRQCDQRVRALPGQRGERTLEVVRPAYLHRVQ